MAKNILKRMQTWQIVLAVVLVATLAFFVFKGKGCTVDQDCPKDQICTIESKCEPKPSDPWDAWIGVFPDKRCPINSVTDPDCPKFCPLGTPISRAGEAGFCCYNGDGTQLVDCETQKVVYPTEINSFGETINILPNYPTTEQQSFIGQEAVFKWYKVGAAEPAGSTAQMVVNQITWNAPAAFPAGVSGVDLWLDHINITAVSPLTLASGDNFKNAWLTSIRGDHVDGANPQPAWDSVTVAPSGTKYTISGTPNKFENIAASATSKWTTTDAFDINMPFGTYNIDYNYCYRAAQYSADRCVSLYYTLEISSDEISFTVSPALV